MRADPDRDAFVLDLLLLSEDAKLSPADLELADRVLGLSAGAAMRAAEELLAGKRLARTPDGVFSAALPFSSRQRQWRTFASIRRVWTGCWLIAAPASEAGAAVTDTLLIEGFRPTLEGLWLRPDTVIGGIDACRARLQQVDALATVLTGRLDRLEIDRALAAKSLWPVEALAAGRQALTEGLQASSAAMVSQAAPNALREGLALSAAAVRAIADDPVLPLDWDLRPLTEDVVLALQDHETTRRELWTAAQIAARA